MIPPQLSTELEMMDEPETVLEVRQVRIGNTIRFEALIKWKHLPAYEATWEDVTLLNNQFPAFHLEDKVRLWGAGIVMQPEGTRGLKTYARTKKRGKKVIAEEVNK